MVLLSYDWGRNEAMVFSLQEMIYPVLLPHRPPAEKVVLLLKLLSLQLHARAVKVP